MHIVHGNTAPEIFLCSFFWGMFFMFLSQCLQGLNSFKKYKKEALKHIEEKTAFDGSISDFSKMIHKEELKLLCEEMNKYPELLPNALVEKEKLEEIINGTKVSK